MLATFRRKIATGTPAGGIAPMMLHQPGAAGRLDHVIVGLPEAKFKQ